MTASDRIRAARDVRELETPAIVAELAAIADATIRAGQAIPYTEEQQQRRHALTVELERRDDDARRAEEGDEQRDYAEERANAAELEEEQPADIVTCGACGLSWNDAIPTSWSPAPSARCPFEYEHHEDGTPTHPAEIPADFPVRPIGHDPRARPIGESIAADVLETLETDAARAGAHGFGIGDVARHRLEELRAELRAEQISYGELAELQSLAEHIDPGDVELLEAAGVPEFPDDDKPEHYAPPAELAGTVFDPSSPTFGPIMAAIQRGDFADAAALLLELEPDEPAGAATDPRPDPRTHPEAWTE